MRNLMIGLVLLLGVFTNTNAQKIEINNENIIAQRIEGEWAVSQELTNELLGGKLPLGDSAIFVFEFDSSIVNRIQQELLDYFKIKKIFFAGKGSLASTKIIFFLFGSNGQTFFMFAEDKEVPRWKEPNCLSLAVGAQKENDLLFFGRDDNCNRPQMLLKRVLKKKKSSSSVSSNDVVEVNFDGEMVKASYLCEAAPLSAEDADALAVKDINEAMSGPENYLLDVNLRMADKFVENRIFLFSIESKMAGKLTLQLFDEEGYSILSSCNFDVSTGKNYKVVGLEKIKGNKFILRIKNNKGGKIDKDITINNK